MPPAVGEPVDSYVDIRIQFATHDQKAVDAFTALEPIVKANVLALLMAQSTAGLQSDPFRSAIIAQCLQIANATVEKNANYQAPPFINGYITNLMVQSSDCGGQPAGAGPVKPVVVSWARRMAASASWRVSNIVVSKRAKAPVAAQVMAPAAMAAVCATRLPGVV
jgi:hypothetical protein